MKHTLLILLICIPLIFSCNKKNKKNNTETKSKVECNEDDCFIGNWEIYETYHTGKKEFIGIFIIKENGMVDFDCEDAFDHVLLNFINENSEEYEEDPAIQSPICGWYTKFEDNGKFCIDIWIPNTVIGGLDNIGAKCYKYTWKNENTFILTKEDGSELVEYRRKTKKK